MKKNALICALHGTKPCEHKHGILGYDASDGFSSEDEPVFAEYDSGSDTDDTIDSSLDLEDDNKVNDDTITNAHIPVPVWADIDEPAQKCKGQEKDYHNRNSTDHFVPANHYRYNLSLLLFIV